VISSRGLLIRLRSLSFLPGFILTLLNTDSAPRRPVFTTIDADIHRSLGGKEREANGINM